jgi:site-specific recombinase
MPVAGRYPRVLEEALVMIQGLTIATPRALTGHNFHSCSKASRTNRVRGFDVLTNVGLLWLVAFSGALENSQTFICGFFAWRHSYSPVEKRRLYHCVIRNPMKAGLNHVIS